MEFIVSHRHVHETARRMQESYFFNLWSRNLWPLGWVRSNDTLYWYESQSQRILWESRAVNVQTFQYSSKKAAIRELRTRFHDPDLDLDHWYVAQAKSQGYCLAWEIKNPRRLNLPKPTGLHFPQGGWLRVDDGIARMWLSKPHLQEETLDRLAPQGTLAQRLHELDRVMARYSPERVDRIVSQTIRQDTQLVRTLKALCRYRCQFPGCESTIPMRNGGSYIEVAHLKPVRVGGKSVLGNLLVLCPNHHKEFDYGLLQISKQTPEKVKGRLNGRAFEIDFNRLLNQLSG